MRVIPVQCFGVGLIYALGGCIGIIAGLVLAHKDYQLNHEGIAASAIVTAMTSKQYSKGTEYHVSYLYQDTSGVYHDGDCAVWYSEWRTLRVNGSVPVLFVRANPGENRINLPYETKLYHDNGTSLPLFCSFLAFVGVALMLAARFNRTFPSAPRFTQETHHPKPNTFHKTY